MSNDPDWKSAREPAQGQRTLPGWGSSSVASVQWLAAFSFGLAGVLLLWFSSPLWAQTHDSVVLPQLYPMLLPAPNCWLVSALLAVLALVCGTGHSPVRLLWAFALGAWLGVMVAYDWWYIVPHLLAMLLAVIVWRINWLHWSQSRLAAAATLALVGLVVAGAVLDFSPLPAWDNRFGFGAPLARDRIFAAALLGAGIATLVGWAFWENSHAEARHRGLLTDLIERDPRAGAYFETTARITDICIPGTRGHPSRFVEAAPPQGAGGRKLESSLAWQSWSSSWRRAKQQVRTALRPRLEGARGSEGIFTAKLQFHPWLDVLWGLGYLVSVIPLAARLSRWLRPKLTSPGLPSVAVRHLLAEGVIRTHGDWCAAWLDPAGAKAPNLFLRLRERSDEQRAQDMAAADRLFARYIRLREAQIEAEIYFGLRPPIITPTEVRGWLHWLQAVPLPGDRGFRNGHEPVLMEAVEANEKVAATWRRAAAEYEALWFENCDHIFLTRAETFSLPLFEPVQIRDLNGLLVKLSLDGQAGYFRHLIGRLAPKVEAQFPPLGQPPADPEAFRRLLAGALNLILETPCLRQEAEVSPLSRGNRETVPPGSTPAPGSSGELGRAHLVRANRKMIESVFGDVLASASDLVDFQALSRSWLASRRGGRNQPVGIHSVAVDLALALFAMNDEDPALARVISDELRRRYFDPHEQFRAAAPSHRKLESEEFREAGRCAVIYGLWHGSQWNWREAAMPLNLRVDGLTPFSGPSFAAQSPLVLRAAAHIDAANLRCRHGGTVDSLAASHDESGGGAWLETVLSHYCQLDDHPERIQGLFDGRCSGEVLACGFADNLLR